MLGMVKRPDWDNVVIDLPGILDRIFVFIENCFFFQKTKSYSSNLFRRRLFQGK